MRTLILLCVLLYVVYCHGDSWVQVSSNPVVGLYYSKAFITSNDTMYIFGGAIYGGGRSNSFLCFDTKSNKWLGTRNPQGISPPVRSAHSIILTRDEKMVIVFAGRGENSARYNDIALFDMQGNAWISHATQGIPPPPRTLHTAVATYNNTMIVHGGSQGSGGSFFSDIGKYDIATDTWIPVTPSGGPAKERSGHSAVITKDNIMVVFGGWNGVTIYNDVAKYDCNTDTWLSPTTPVGEAPHERFDHGAVITSTGIMMIYGGYFDKPSDTWFNTMHHYNVSSDTWLPVSASGQQPYEGRDGFAVGVTSSNAMIMWGGYRGGAYLSDFVKYQYGEAPLELSSTFASTVDSSSNVENTDSSNLGEEKKDKKDSSTNVTSIVIGVVVGVVAAIILILIVVLVVFKKNKKKSKPTSSIEMGVTNSSSGSRSGNSGGSSGGSGGSFRAEDYGSNYSAINAKPSKKKGKSWEILWDEINVENELGRGAFGIVYKGHWRNQSVAVKRVIGEFSQKQMEEFLLEAELMSKLRPHENVIQFLGVCTAPLAIITKFYSNGSLSNYIENHDDIPIETVIGVLKGIAAGMTHLHHEKIVHRDLACRNILLGSGENGLQAVVSDFGFARTLDKQEATTQSTIGPVRWMSPESLTQASYSNKSDVWSFGVVVWEMITKKLPWSEFDDINAILAISAGKTLKIPDSCPPALRDIVEKCWETEPDKRPSFQKIFELLEKVPV